MFQLIVGVALERERERAPIKGAADDDVAGAQFALYDHGCPAAAAALFRPGAGVCARRADWPAPWDSAGGAQSLRQLLAAAN